MGGKVSVIPKTPKKCSYARFQTVREDISVTLKQTKFVVLCHSSHEKLIQGATILINIVWFYSFQTSIFFNYAIEKE